MKQSKLLSVSLFALVASAALPVLAQTSTRERTTTTEYYAPYQKEFWNYAGISGGATKNKSGCSGNCDDKDAGFKVYAGGKFREWLGLELGYVNAGKFRMNGDMEAQGLTANALFGLPLGPNSGIFAKAGAVYGQSKFNGAKTRGWEPTYGAGAAIGINRNLQVRLDYDRLRFEVPGRTDNIDMLSAGLQIRY